jgi:hypothetical protein
MHDSVRSGVLLLLHSILDPRCQRDGEIRETRSPIGGLVVMMLRYLATPTVSGSRTNSYS